GSDERRAVEARLCPARRMRFGGDALHPVPWAAVARGHRRAPRARGGEAERATSGMRSRRGAAAARAAGAGVARELARVVAGAPQEGPPRAAARAGAARG